MSKCQDCFRYRAKEREIAALRHELDLMTKQYEDMVQAVRSEPCLFTARARFADASIGRGGPYAGAAGGMGGAGAAGGNGGAGAAQQQAFNQVQAIQQNAAPNAYLAGLSSLQAQQGMGAAQAYAQTYQAQQGYRGAGGAWCETHQCWGEECKALGRK
jgi:hypothetical protein